MARANLTISSELQALFAGALEDKSIRWIQAKVEGEAVVQGEIGKATDSTEADFDGLSGSLPDRSAAFVIFAVDTSAEAGSERSFVLISWVPDLCPVRKEGCSVRSRHKSI